MKSLSIFIAFLILGTAVSAETGASNTWTKKSYAIKGTWKIEDGQIKLLDFSTKKAPDLKIFLSTMPLHKITNKNALEGAKLVIKLKSHKGDQSYAIPQGLDLSIFKTILIHCEKYSKLWGGATL
jgi:hypothetical protein